MLGYLEGRPGVQRILKVEPFKLEEGWTPKADRSISRATKERVRELPMVQEAKGHERRRLIREIEDAYEEADDGGAWIETEIDYEEAES